MDMHLKVLFDRFQHQFGVGPGLGPSSGTCLLTVDTISPSFIKSLFRASAALFRSNPWKRLRPGHLFGIRVGKDNDWIHKRQPFPCAQFIGGDGGDIGFMMFHSQQDAERVSPPGSRVTHRVPNVEVLRLSYELDSFISASNRQMIRSLSLESSGPDRYPTIDVARCTATGGLRFRNPTVDEVKFAYAFMSAALLVHPLLQEAEEEIPKWRPLSVFEPFIETVDVQWPPEISKGDWDLVAVTISHPPGQAHVDKTKTSLITTSPDYPVAEGGEFENTEMRGTVTRQCLMCGKETRGDRYLSCGRCRAVVYCGPGCQKLHLKENHKNTCELYKAMMEREEELTSKMFAFPCVVEHPCQWLESLHLHKKGMWRRACSCFMHCHFGLLPVKGGLSDAWGGLGKGEYPPDSPVFNDDGSSGPILLSSWSEYYSLRSLPLSSPVSAILSHPLTIHNILTVFSINSKNLLFKGREVVLHYIGPEGELDWMPAFAEIGYLLNGFGNLQIVMVGPEVPSNLSGTILGINSRVRVNLIKGVYQEEVTYLPAPHVIIALNCGLENGGSWGAALESVKSLDVPTFFTDQSELSCSNAKQVLRTVGLHITLPIAPNPFRSPLRSLAPSTNLPQFNNGFVFGVNT